MRFGSSSAEEGIEFARTLWRRALRVYYAEIHFYKELDNMADSSVRRMLIWKLLEDFMKGKLDCPELDASNYFSQKLRFDNS